jgi:hypothetical protein
MFFEIVRDEWHQFNQSMLLRVVKKMRPEMFIRAVNQLVTTHSMLRARFDRSHDGSWKQRISADISGSYRLLTHRTQPDQVETLIENSQKSLDIEHGPLIAFDLFDLPSDDTLLSIVAHHLVIDIVSWHIILADVEELLSGSQPKPDISLTFKTWTRLQAENTLLASSSEVLPVSEVPAADYGYWGMADKPNVSADICEENVQLDSALTAQLLQSCHEHLRSDPVDVLLASLLLSFRREFSDRQPCAIFNEGHGREPWDQAIDLSSSVGWFTTLSPVMLPYQADVSEGEKLFMNTLFE